MAASFGPYFMNAETFSETSGLWTSNLLTGCAPSGYYSNGVIIRYLDNAGGIAGCCLGPALDCPQCEPPVFECGTTWDTNGGVKEIYETTVNTGSGTGVVLVGVNPANIPDGVASRFPAGLGGTIYSSGSAQFLGFASCNYTGASTNLYDHACYVGNISAIDTGWPAIQVGAQCSGIEWDCVGDPPPISESGYQRKQWNNAIEDWEDVPGAPLVSAEISNYNVGSGVGTSNDTQMRPLGLNAAGVCVANDSIAPCIGTTGYFWIPIPKTSFFDQQVEVCFIGGPDASTGFNFAFQCPQMPTQFGVSDLTAPLLSSPDPLATPTCSTVAYTDVLYQVSVWGVEGGYTSTSVDSNTSNAISNGLAISILGQHCFAYQTALGTGLRLNEGGTEYQWFKVNLNTGGGNANRMITIGTTGQNAIWQNYPELQAALIQVDWNGVITRLEPCEF
jgi:hypothetical protein